MDKIINNDKLPVVVLPVSVLLQGRQAAVRLGKIGDSLYHQIRQSEMYALVLAAKGGKVKEVYDAEDLYTTGLLVRFSEKPLKTPYGDYEIQVLERIKVTKLEEQGEFWSAYFDTYPNEVDLEDKEQQEVLSYIKDITGQISEHFRGSSEFMEGVRQIHDLQTIIAYLIPYINLSGDERQAFLEITSLKEKSLRFLDLLMEHKESIEFQMELATKVSSDFNESYRKNMLKKQLEVIQEELDEGEDNRSKKKKKDFFERIKESDMPEEVREVAMDEAHKLKRNGSGAEANVIQNYLELLLALPWGKSLVKDIDIKQARKILDQEHYGLDKVKDRIIQHLTVMKLKENKQGSILLLVGPPGTGKTSLGKSIAKALDRQYVRASLGGMRDEAEIRGHRRTYVGAFPGRIIQGIKKAKTKNPVFILDEVDKLMASAQGDPASALLEVLDPEQNNSFSDHYLELPYDLSDVFFIATANSLKGIPGPLLDRMEVIEVSSYTEQEKFHIAKDHLWTKVLEDHGLQEDQVQVEEEALREIITSYTREAGVRALKQQLSKVARVVSQKIVELEVPLPYILKKDNLQEVLGHEVNRYDKILKINPPGVVTGLAWTPVGGDILFIEGAMMPGKGNLLLTGQLGDVMKESAKISQTLVRSRLSSFMKGIQLDKQDLHIHVPAGATPKDGPSAGVTLFTAIASLVTGRPVDPTLAMTGEISLRGAVMPVGGIKEKVLAAHRSGIKRILLPKENEKNLEDIPQEVRAELTFIFAETVEEVIRESLGIDLPTVKVPEMTLPEMPVMK